MGPNCPPSDKGTGLWWLARDSSGNAVGFCGVTYHSQLEHHEPCGFLCRVGVLPEARGNGLQRRFIRTAERQARRDGLQVMVTYTHNLNSHSANNFIACGYRVYAPRHYWGLADGIYLRREL